MSDWYEQLIARLSQQSEVPSPLIKMEEEGTWYLEPPKILETEKSKYDAFYKWIKCLYGFQQKTAEEMIKYIKGTCIHPTGTGKTLIEMYLIVSDLIEKDKEGKTGVYAIGAPLLLLCQQLLREFVNILIKIDIRLSIVFIGSSSNDKDYYDKMKNSYGRDIRTCWGTNIKRITKFIDESRERKEHVIVVSTYDSFHKMKNLDKIDMCIYDEAHETTEIGFTKNILQVMDIIKRNYFFTATEEIIGDKFGMANEDFYGPTISWHSIIEMIKLGYVVPPVKLWIRTIDNKLYHESPMIVKTIINAYEKTEKIFKKISSKPEMIGTKLLVAVRGIKEVREVRNDANFIKYCQENKIHVLAFNSPNEYYYDFGRCKNRLEIMIKMWNLKDNENAILLNCRMLTQGIDLPSLTAVLPLRPLTELEIAQLIGRGMRRLPYDMKMFGKGKEEQLNLQTEKCLDHSFNDKKREFWNSEHEYKPINELIKPLCFVVLAEDYEPIRDSIDEMDATIMSLYNIDKKTSIHSQRKSEFSGEKGLERDPVTPPNESKKKEKDNEFQYEIEDIIVDKNLFILKNSEYPRKHILELDRDIFNEMINNYRYRNCCFGFFHEKYEGNCQHTLTPRWLVKEMIEPLPYIEESKYCVFNAFEFIYQLKSIGINGKRILFIGDTREECDFVKKLIPGCETYVYLISKSYEDNFYEIKAILDKMPAKFTICCGNPPYSIPGVKSDNNSSSSKGGSKDIYYNFVEHILKYIDPEHFVFIIPSRWYNGTGGSEKLLNIMKNNNHIKTIKDYSEKETLQDIFNGVAIGGGVMWFHLDKNYSGPCDFNGISYDLKKYPDFIIRPEYHSILDKILSKTKSFAVEDVRSNPFGIKIDKNPKSEKNSHGFSTSQNDEYIIPCFTSHGTYFLKNDETINKKRQIIDQYKVVTSEAYGCGLSNRKIINNPWILNPGSICSGSYIVLYSSDSAEKAKNYKRYVETKFYRFLVMIKRKSQHNARTVFSLIPKLDYSLEIKDETLYNDFGLISEEIEMIEESIISLQDEVKSSDLDNDKREEEEKENNTSFPSSIDKFTAIAPPENPMYAKLRLILEGK